MKKFFTAGLAAFCMMNLFSTEAIAMEGLKAVKVVQTAGRDRLGDFAPEFARYNDDILFGEVWNRNDILSLRQVRRLRARIRTL